MTKQKRKQNALIGIGIGIVIYLVAWGWAEYTTRNNIGVGANIGAGMLGLLGQAIAGCSAIVWLAIVLFGKD